MCGEGGGAAADKPDMGGRWEQHCLGFHRLRGCWWVVVPVCMGCLRHMLLLEGIMRPVLKRLLCLRHWHVPAVPQTLEGRAWQQSGSAGVQLWWLKRVLSVCCRWQVAGGGHQVPALAATDSRSSAQHQQVMYLRSAAVCTPERSMQGACSWCNAAVC